MKMVNSLDTLDVDLSDAFERRLAEVLAFVRDQKARQMLPTQVDESK